MDHLTSVVMFSYFSIFLSSVLFFAFVFIIENWSIVYLWDIFFCDVSLLLFLFPLLLDFIVRGGPRVLGHGAAVLFIFKRR